jgi:hypothetical protein
MADEFIMRRNQEKGTNKPTLSQVLGIDFERAQIGDYYYAILRGIKKLGSTTGDTSLKLRTK